MLNYCCRVTNRLGDIQEVNIEATDVNDLKIRLLKENMTLLSYNRSGKTSGIKLKSDEILNFTQTLSILLNSNLTLNDALNVALTTFKKGKLNFLIKTVLTGLTKGEKFSKLLKSNVIGFPPIYIGLIQVGEKTGNLDNVLKHLNSYLTRNKNIKSKLKLALIYPTFILSIGFISSILFTFLILPMFYQMFNTLGEDISKILNERGQIFTNITTTTSILFISLVIYILRIKSLSIRNVYKAAPFEKIYLKLPKIGALILENQSLNLIFALNVLTESSITIEESLTFSKDVVTNSYLKIEIEKIKKRIVTGESLSLSFSKSYFPQKISSYIKVGEKTGNINQILNSLSDYYMEETNKKIDLFMAIIEPFFIIIIGAALILVLGMFILPILSNLGGLL